MVAECYGLEAFVVAVRSAGGAITAGIPLIRVRRPFRQSRLVALPFTDFCPPLASNDAERARLGLALEEVRETVGADRIVVRGAMPEAPLFLNAGFRHVLRLQPDPAVVYSRFHRSQVQRNIRKAEAGELTLRVSSPGHSLLDQFYALHLATRRRLGVPIQPRRFFELLRDRILEPGIGWIVSVETSGRPIAAAVFLAANGTVVYKFGASDADAWQVRPNHFLFWNAIRAACEAGHEQFDFGRSDPDAGGLRSFKRSWGAEERTLHYHSIGGTPARRLASASEAGLAHRLMRATIRRGPPWMCRLSGELLYRFVA